MKLKSMKNPPLLLFVLGTLLFMISCSRDESNLVVAPALTESEREVIRYFKEVALGFENGNSSEITRKWNSSMKVFVGGNPSDSNVMTLIQAIADINQLATDKFEIELVNDSIASNCYFFFGSGPDFLQMFPDELNNVNANTKGYFHVWWDNNNVINKARIIVNPAILTSVQQKSVILEEIIQSTGLGNDSPVHPNSIFYETSSEDGFATAYADIDKELIRLLYHPKMKVGLNNSQVDRILRDILTNE